MLGNGGGYGKSMEPDDHARRPAPAIQTLYILSKGLPRRRLSKPDGVLVEDILERKEERGREHALADFGSNTCKAMSALYGPQNLSIVKDSPL